MGRYTSPETSFDIRVKDPSDKWRTNAYEKPENEYEKAHFDYRVGKRIDVMVYREKTIQIYARDHRRAIKKAQRQGYIVLNAHKTMSMVEEIAFDRKLIEAINRPIRQRESALALEEIAFRRAKRIEENKKHSRVID
jgi:hypothetical protein